MNTDLNRAIQDKLKRNRKRRNRHRLLSTLCLVAVLVTSTVLTSPAVALTGDISGEVVQETRGDEDGGDQNSDGQPAGSMAKATPASLESDPAEETAEEAADETTADADAVELENDLVNGQSEDGAADEQGALVFEDGLMKITASRKDGGSFPSGMTLGEEEFDEMDAAAAERFLQDTMTKKDTENITSSIVGLHAFELTPEGETDSEDAEDGKIVFTAEFPGGLNDAGYASKAEQSVEVAEDGTSTTQTTKYRTSWRIYLVSEDGLTDITDDDGIPLSNDVGRTEIADDGASLPSEDDFTDITDDDETSLTTDNTGACTGVTFTGKLPEKVVLAQIVRKTVTTASVEEQMPQSAFSFDERVLTEKGSIRVQVDADEGAFDKGTTMTVTPVSSSDILGKAIDAAGGKGAAAAVDIAFTKPDGTQAEPAKPIRVKMTSAVLSRADKAHVVHVDDSGNTDVVAEKTDGQTVESTNGEAVGTDASNAVSFESASFSVYAIVYTVDFTYSNYTYSIEGGSSILLSSLAQELGLRDIAQSRDFDIADVDDVTFSDSSLVSVTKQDGDFVLTSLKPFTSTEKLTITMKDGSKYEVEVKDAQEVDFSKYITSVDTYKKNNGEWQKNSSIQDGDNVKFEINFQIFSSDLSNKQKLMTYTMDSHIAISQQTPLTLYKGTTKVGTGLVDTNGKITINWEDSYDISTGFTGSIMFEGTAHNSGSTSPVTVKFGNKATISINPKNTSNNYDVSTAKTGSYQTDSNGKHYIQYEVTISTTKGTGDAISFTDSMSANGIAVPTYDRNQVRVYKNGTSDSVSGVSPYINSEGKLEIDNLPKLEANENYHVIYNVPVNGEITSADGSASVNNSCYAWNNNVNGWGGTWTKIQDAVIKKTGSYDTNSGKMKWTIIVNNPDQKNLSGAVLEDVLHVTDGDGTNVKLPAYFTIKGSDGSEFAGSFGADGTYTFPSDSSCTAEKYTIEYETSAPAGTAGTTSKVKNSITYKEDGKEYHTDSGDINVYHPTYGVQKWFEQSKGQTDAGEKLQWTARVDLPDGELDLTNLIYTDTMTAWNKTAEITGKHFTTPALLNEATIWSAAGTSLEAGTDYQLQKLDGKDITGSTSTEQLAGFKIKFLDSAITKLKGQECFSLRYCTIADETEQPAGSTWTFKNKATIPDHESEVSHDNKKPDGDLVKQVSLTGADNSYSSDAPEIEYAGNDIILYYRVLIRLNKSSSGEQTIIDTIPAGMTFNGLSSVVYLENENYHPGEIWDNNKPIKLADLVKTPSVEEQTDGTTIVTFRLLDGYERTKDSYLIAFYYTATISDATFWGDLHNTEKEYTNQAVWGNLNAGVTTKVKHTIKNLDKIAQLSDVEETNGEIKKAAYYLTINPLGSDLVPGADTITLKDQLSCNKADVKIQFRPASLKVFAYDGSKQNHCGDEMNQNRYGFSYDEQQHSLELKLPDETPCVVYYEYYVVPGMNQAELSNSASLSGVVNSSTENKLSLSESTATGSVTRDELYIYKVDSDNYRIKLQGVTFELYQYQYVNNTQSWTKVKDSLTTDRDGKIYLNLTDDSLQQGCLYKLLETDVGNNTTYQFDKDKGYYFIWATDDDIKNSRTNQQIWDALNGRDRAGAKQAEVNIIRSSGTLYVPNENTGITINKVWLNADHSDDKNPGEATVTLYRQARQPRGVKVTIVVKNPYDLVPYNHEVYIKSGTSVALLIDTDYGETYSVYRSTTDNTDTVLDKTYPGFNDEKDHQLELGNPTVDTTYTVVASYWSTQKVKDLYYIPTDQYTSIGEKNKVSTYTLNKDNNYSVTVGDLPLQDNSGNKYYYWVEENNVPYYTTSYSGNNGKIQKGTITVTNTRESVMVKASKAWKNKDGADNPPPGSSCVFELYKNGTATGNRITLDGTADDREKPAWTAVFSNLDKYDASGKEIHYTVREVQSTEGYAADHAEVENGGTITNSQEQQLEFTKIWSDGTQNIRWPSGTTIKVSLYRELRDDQNKALTAPEVAATYELDSNSIKAKSPDSAPACIPSEKDGKYTYLISGLPSAGTGTKDGKTVTGTWHYYLTEEKVTGYLDPKYRALNPAGTVVTGNDLPYAENGQAIINQKDSSFALPSTGGHGTLPLKRQGAFLLLLAGTALLVRKLLTPRNTGRGGGS